MDEAADGRFDALLKYLHRARGFNFGGYKRTSLMRRVAKRMQSVAIADYGDYQDFLEVHPEEFAHLFDSLLINVTDFFRDPLCWEVIASETVPRILAGKRPGEPIRVWSAGCATGAEAYTLAMVLAEALGVEAFRDRVKIYATDLDEAALTKARMAYYDPREVANVPPPLLEKYFAPLGPRHVFHKELRRSIIFGRHDLMLDAPISRVDLLACRNTLMYFNGEAQSRILDRFHFGLDDRGFLFLGKAETLLSYNHRFSAIDTKRRIFAKVVKGGRRPPAPPRPRPHDGAPTDGHLGDGKVRDVAFERSPFPQLVIDADGLLALVNESARRLFGLAASDLGRPLQDLQISYRPADLRSCIDQAYAERRAVTLSGVEWPRGLADVDFYDVRVVPLIDGEADPIGASVAFSDVSEARHVKEDLMRSSRELEEAHEELQSANEELETTNEELQSANEELETTNEELQSANEELETTNEELQSANEELHTSNEELRQSGDELDETNLFLGSVLAVLDVGVVLLDADFLIRFWNPKSEDLWGLRSGEVRGKSLLDLDIGLRVQDLHDPIRACLDGRATRESLSLDAVNRRGRAILCKLSCTPMADGENIRGVVLVMEEAAASPGSGVESRTGASVDESS